MYLVVSTTSCALWDNAVPDWIYDFVARHSEETLGVTELPRHHRAVVSGFQRAYGGLLETCPYARLMILPDFLQGFYRVVQPMCYASVRHCEQVEVKTMDCMNHYRGTDDEERVHRQLTVLAKWTGTTCIQYQGWLLS